MIAYFQYRGTEYRVAGVLRERYADGGTEVIVSRTDGRRIRGERTHPGMVQTGISDGLSRAALRALARRAAEED